jgi:iron-sulfur cluster assembly accessory protein
MITLTAAAVKQIRLSAKEGHMEGLPMRIAATKNDDGSIHYGMGFDDAKEADISHSSDGIKIIVSTETNQIVDGMKIDYVEIEVGKAQFIFMNPHDANYSEASVNL